MIPAIFGHASKKIILTLGNNYITNYVISYIFNNTTGDGNMDFFNRTGKMAIGSRLRMLTDKITNDAALIFRMYGVDIRPKWFPVFFVLSEGEAKTITSIAREIGHSHPSVSNIVKEMGARGLVKEKKDKTDGRRNLVMLSAKGKKMSDIMAEQYPDVEAAVEQISRQTRNDLWRAIEEWEGLLAEKTNLRTRKKRSSFQHGATGERDTFPISLTALHFPLEIPVLNHLPPNRFIQNRRLFQKPPFLSFSSLSLPCPTGLGRQIAL